MSSVKFRERVPWVYTVAVVTVIGLSGCTAAPSAGPPPTDSGGSSSTPVGEAVEPEPAGTVGPTERPELAVVEGALNEAVELPTGFVVALDSISTTAVTAETPGDVAGDAVVVVVEVRNTSKEPQNVDSAVVTLETGDGELGIPTIAGDPSPLTGDIPPESSAKGRYLFMLDPATGRDITISVNYAAGEPVAQFTGRTQ